MNRLSSLFMTLVIAAVWLTACGIGAATPGPDDPVNSLTPMPPTGNPYDPQPGDADLERGEAFVEETELLVMESFPLQFMLSLSGSLPTPCHQLRIVAAEPDAANNIAVEVYTVFDPDQICIQVLESFSANVNLGSYPQGHYTLSVNGEVVSEFDA